MATRYNYNRSGRIQVHKGPDMYIDYNIVGNRIDYIFKKENTDKFDFDLILYLFTNTDCSAAATDADEGHTLIKLGSADLHNKTYDSGPRSTYIDNNYFFNGNHIYGKAYCSAEFTPGFNCENVTDGNRYYIWWELTPNIAYPAFNFNCYATTATCAKVTVSWDKNINPNVTKAVLNMQTKNGPKDFEFSSGEFNILYEFEPGKTYELNYFDLRYNDNTINTRLTFNGNNESDYINNNIRYIEENKSINQRYILTYDIGYGNFIKTTNSIILYNVYSNINDAKVKIQLYNCYTKKIIKTYTTINTSESVTFNNLPHNTPFEICLKSTHDYSIIYGNKPNSFSKEDCDLVKAIYISTEELTCNIEDAKVDYTKLTFKVITNHQEYLTSVKYGLIPYADVADKSISQLTQSDIDGYSLVTIYNSLSRQTNNIIRTYYYIDSSNNPAYLQYITEYYIFAAVSDGYNTVNAILKIKTKGGIVKVNVNGEWKNALAYVYTDGKWKMALPYVSRFNGGSDWRVTGG